MVVHVPWLQIGLERTYSQKPENIRIDRSCIGSKVFIEDDVNLVLTKDIKISPELDRISRNFTIEKPVA